MPKQSYGKINQQRAQALFAALLDFANDDLEADEKELERIRSQIQTHWQTEKKLVIRTKTRYLESLMKLAGGTFLSIEQIKTALKHLENYLGILSDHRTAQRGSDNWHFTINLWCDRWQRAGNLAEFDRTWLQQGTMRIIDINDPHPLDSLRAKPSPLPVAPQNSLIAKSTIDWHSICRQALDTNISSNSLMGNIGKAFDLNDIYLPLGVEERQALEEEPIRYQPSELITKLLGTEETNRTAIIGSPGAGKTTLLQKIALSLLETNCLPIWISLADLGDRFSSRDASRSLEEYLTQTWLKDALCVFQASLDQQQELVQQVNAGQVWLLLDAIDEIGTASSALTNIAKQLKGWLSQAHVILTCRSNLWDGEKNALVDFDTYKILSFSHASDGVPAFIRSWFQDSPELGEKLSLKLTQKSMERIHSCVTNPLYLALLCRSWMLNQGQLPSTKTSLYRQFIEAIYSWKQDLFPTSLRQRQSLNQALSQLALQAMQQTESIFRLSQTMVFAAFVADLDLLTLALNLGLLKQSGQSSGNPVYAFHHPTFQEYFAAQAIPDQQQFLAFNIFELKWREVLPLWLGREDIADRSKESLLQTLLNFTDNCGGFYRYRAYFLATEGVAEFPAFSLGDEIVFKLVNLRYLGAFDRSIPTTITERAGIALSKTDRVRVIQALEQFIRLPSPHHPQSIWLAAHSLGRNYDAGNRQAIVTLETMLTQALDDYSKFSVAKSLIAIAPDHQLAIYSLIQIIKSSGHSSLQRRAARRLQAISSHNPIAAKVLAELTTDPHLCELFLSIDNAQKSASHKSSRNQQSQKNLGDPTKLVASLVQKLQSDASINIKIRLANHLAKYEPGHPLVLESLLYCLENCDQKAYLKQVGESLRNLVSINQLPKVIPQIRDIYLKSTGHNIEQHHESYRILWYWSRLIAHQEFEHLWCLPRG
jgi:Effector-associated domain 4/NACHT domain